MKKLSALRPEDYALMAVSPADAPKFLVGFGMEPESGADRWSLVSGMDSPERALAKAHRELGRGLAFTVERLAVADRPWPVSVPGPIPAYRLERQGFVLLVPFPAEGALWDNHEAMLFARVAGVARDEEAAQALLRGVDCRAMLGRIHALVDLTMGYEMPHIIKGERKAGPGA